MEGSEQGNTAPMGVAAPVVNTGTMPTAPTGQPQAPQGQSLDTTQLAQEVARLMQPPKEEEATPQPLEGLFNSELPEEFQGDVAIEGLFAIARHQFPDLNLNRVLGTAWQEGDPSKVDTSYLAEVVGADMAKYYSEYFAGVIGNHVEAQEARNNEWAQGVFEEFGGKPNWDRVVGAFNTNAEPGIIAHVKGLLDSPDMESRNIGINMIRNFVQPLGVMPQKGRKLGGAAGAIPGSGANALSAADFMTEVAKLSNTGKYTKDAVAELRQRRALGVQLGL